MANPDYPKQPPASEMMQPAEQSPKNDTGDLALLAEFYAERFRQNAESASEGTRRNVKKNADEMARVQSLLFDLAKERFNTPTEADKMLEQLEQGYVDTMDKAASNEEAEENDRSLSAVLRARTFLEQNQNVDIYGRKDFSDWLTARNARLRKERQAQSQERTQTERARTAGQVEEAYKQLGVESPTEREKSRERAAELVLQDGGVRIHASVERSLSTKGYSGFQNLETRIQDNRNPSYARSGIEAQFLAPGESSRGVSLDEALKKLGIKEIIDIRHDTRPAYETVAIPGKKGVFGIGKTPDHTEEKFTGRYEQVLHSEHVRGGKKEPAVRFTYYIPQTEWRDYSGRSGQAMIAEIVLPESVAKEVEQTVERDPVAMRKIVERVMKEKLLKDPKAWETPQGSGDSLRPPYDRWDAEPGGGKIYVQKEAMTPGFHEEALKKVQK